MNVSGCSPADKIPRYIELQEQSPAAEDQPLHEPSPKAGVSRRDAEGAGTACLEVCRELGVQQGNFWTSMQQHLGRRPPGSVSAGGYSQELLLRRVNTGVWPAQEQVYRTMSSAAYSSGHEFKAQHVATSGDDPSQPEHQFVTATGQVASRAANSLLPIIRALH
ncbi:TPA: hypothetical protein ACH3X1_013646 [Trebouxia sp. C0004]